MKSHFDVNAYLSQAEAQFSGFGGDMYSFDDNSEIYFNADDLYSVDAAPAATAVRRSPSPYQIAIVNSTA